jgi:hypothetical protein
MNAIMHLESKPSPEAEPALHDHVRVPDGREGNVIGFYRRTYESVLVLFDVGGSQEFFALDVEIVR